MAQAREHPAVRVLWIVVQVAALLPCAVAAAGPALGTVWLETQLTDPERSTHTGRGITPLDPRLYRFEQGVYKSVFSRIALTLPVLGGETQVAVRQSVIFRRPDGSPITTHVLFVPGPIGLTLNTADGVTAVVVTRLRDDRPKDRNSVLRNFEPPDEAQRIEFERKGTTHARVPTAMGESLQRVTRNRLATDPFPYRTQVVSSSAAHSYGVTRFVVIEGDSLIEFSQVQPCGGLPEGECRDRAVSAIDQLVSSVREFLTYPPGAANK